MVMEVFKSIIERKKSLQFRLIIKLQLSPENIKMLTLIQSHIGGRVKTTKDQFIIWVVDSRKSIIKIIRIFETYPPLTSRLISQLNFMKECLICNDVMWYLNNRDQKYSNYKTNYIINPLYFFEWLSGFIEAEGCFTIRQKNNHSFSIGQKNDKYILEIIRTHFEIQSKIRNLSDNFWLLETYRKSTLQNIITHCITYPLLGEKKVSFYKFKNLIL